MNLVLSGFAAVGALKGTLHTRNSGHLAQPSVLSSGTSDDRFRFRTVRCAMPHG